MSTIIHPLFAQTALPIEPEERELYEAALQLEKERKYKDVEQNYLRLLRIRNYSIDSITFTYQRQLANNYSQMGDYASAFETAKKNVTLARKVFDNNHSNYSFAIYDAGLKGLQAHVLDESEKFLTEAVHLYSQNGKKNKEYSDAVNNLAGLYKLSKEYKKAEQYYLEAKTIRSQVIGKTSLEYAISLNNIASLYREMGDIKQAIEYYSEALEILEKVAGKSHPYYIGLLLNIGNLYLASNSLDQATLYLSKGLSLAKQHLGKQHSYTLVLFRLNASLYAQKGNLKQEEYYLLQSLYNNTYLSIKEQKDFINPLQTLCEQDAFIDKPNALRAYITLANNQETQYLNTDSIAYLKKVFALSQQLELIVKTINNSFEEEGDKLSLLKDADSGHEVAIRSAELLYQKTGEEKYLEQALNVAEQSKSVILNESLQSENALHFGEVPDSLRLKEQNLQQKSAQLEKQLLEAKLRRDSARIITLNRAISIFSEQKEAFIQQLESQYPRYHQLKYSQSTFSIQQFAQQELKKGDLLIEYYSGPKEVYAFSLNASGELKCLRLNISSDSLRTMASSFLRNLSNYDYITQHPKQATAEYQQLAFHLYELLVAPLLEKKLNRLIIIPDGMLALIPFEAFLTEKPAAELPLSHYPFLIRQQSLSYHYAAKLLLQQQHSSKNAFKGMLALAASYQNTHSRNNDRLNNIRQHLSELPQAQQEVLALQDKFEGQFLFNEQANESTFKKLAKDYSIIHLAVHGIANTQHPILSGLVLSDEGTEEDNFLHAYEISQMQLQSDLIVLSACETGYGKLSEGEGVMSIGRAFMYAGVPSLVVSLWQVNDASTAKLMQSFYKQLALGLAKDLALQKAKLSYLEEQQDGLAAHPAYWAAFIHLGDAQPLPKQLLYPKKQSSLLTYSLIAVASLLIIIFLFFLNKKRTPSKRNPSV